MDDTTSQLPKEYTFTTSQVKTIHASLKTEIAQLQGANTAKDADIARLQKYGNDAYAEIKRLENELDQTQRERDAARLRSAVKLTFKTTFPTVRLFDNEVEIVVLESEPLNNAMMDFSTRIGKFIDHLEFRFGGQVVSRIQRVDQVSLYT